MDVQSGLAAPLLLANHRRHVFCVETPMNLWILFNQVMPSHFWMYRVDRKQCGSWSAGFWWSQLNWIYTDISGSTLISKEDVCFLLTLLLIRWISYYSYQNYSHTAAPNDIYPIRVYQFSEICTYSYVSHMHVMGLWMGFCFLLLEQV